MDYFLHLKAKIRLYVDSHRKSVPPLFLWFMFLAFYIEIRGRFEGNREHFSPFLFDCIFREIHYGSIKFHMFSFAIDWVLLSTKCLDIVLSGYLNLCLWLSKVTAGNIEENYF